MAIQVDGIDHALPEDEERTRRRVSVDGSKGAGLITHRLTNKQGESISELFKAVAHGLRDDEHMMRGIGEMIPVIKTLGLNEKLSSHVRR